MSIQKKIKVLISGPWYNIWFPVTLIVFVLVWWQQSFTDAILSITFLAIFWYSLETRCMRLQQIKDFQLKAHPWLDTELICNSHPDEDAMGREHVRLRLRNTGLSTAKEIRLETKFKGPALKPDCDQSDHLNVLVPSADAEFDVCSFELEQPGVEITVEIVVHYKALDSGGGRIRIEKRLRSLREEYAWTPSIVTKYEYWLRKQEQPPGTRSLESRNPI